MEVCVLKFKKADQAEEVLTKLVSEHGDEAPWAHEVGVIKRPLIGRISIRTTYDDAAPLREGDIASTVSDAGKWTGYLLGSLAGPMHARLNALRAKRVVAPVAKWIERALTGIDDIKEWLPRGSSALILVAAPETCEQMVRAFAPEHPEAIRRDVGAELREFLENVGAQDGQASASAE